MEVDSKFCRFIFCPRLKDLLSWWARKKRRHGLIDLAEIHIKKLIAVDVCSKSPQRSGDAETS